MDSKEKKGRKKAAKRLREIAHAIENGAPCLGMIEDKQFNVYSSDGLTITRAWNGWLETTITWKEK